MTTYKNISPFGSPLLGRTYQAESLVKYRFGFNGKENDSETGTQDYGARIYNSGLARFLSIDPLTKEYPFYTPYQFAGNMPICAIDIDGAEEYFCIDGSYIGAGPEKDCKEVRVVSEDVMAKVMGNVELLNKGIENKVYSFQTVPIMSEINSDGETKYADVSMTSDELLDQAHVIYGESAGKEGTKLAHIMRNREIKLAKKIEKTKNTAIGYNTDGSKIYPTEANSKLLRFTKQFGFKKYLIFGLHKPNNEDAIEKHKSVIEDGSPQIDGGIENKNYADFYKNKSNIKLLQAKLPISKTILSDIFKARLNQSKDPNPNADGWRGDGKTNNPTNEMPDVKSD